MKIYVYSECCTRSLGVCQDEQKIEAYEDNPDGTHDIHLAYEGEEEDIIAEARADAKKYVPGEGMPHSGIRTAWHVLEYLGESVD